MSTVHFRCSFDLHAQDAEDSWANLLRTVRKWIAQRPQPQDDDDFWKGWFFKGGEWKSQEVPGIRVLTRSCYGDGTPQSPNVWSAEYEHPCDDSPGYRVWRVHVGIEQFDAAKFHFNFQTVYQMRPGHIGPAPTLPLPSSPGLIMKLLMSDFWRCVAGREELSANAKILNVGHGKDFEQLLISKERACPVVLISHVFQNQGYTIDPAKLARLLGGTGIVFRSESSEVDEELEYVLGRRFSCWNGMIRVYVPGLDFERKGDFKRHRYILIKDVQSWGVDRTIEILVAGMARRNVRPRGVLTPIDVEAVFRRRRIAELRAQQASGTKDEWIRLLEEENETLSTAKAQLEDSNVLLQETVEEQQGEIRRLKYEKKSLRANLAQGNRVGNPNNMTKRLENLKQLPRSLREVVDKIASIHSDRIVFTKRAIQSADESGFRDIHTAWWVLWSMATTLYEHFFEQGVNNIERVFRDYSGIELAMTERKLTNQDKKLMALRRDTFEGQKIDITPHVKFDDDTTRAYFCPFRQNGIRRIVVGYIGHLDTAGSRRH